MAKDKQSPSRNSSSSHIDSSCANWPRGQFSAICTNVLSQLCKDDKWCLIGFMPKSLSEANRNYKSMTRNFLQSSEVWRQRHILEGTKPMIEISNDHRKSHNFQTIFKTLELPEIHVVRVYSHITSSKLGPYWPIPSLYHPADPMSNVHPPFYYSKLPQGCHPNQLHSSYDAVGTPQLDPWG